MKELASKLIVVVFICLALSAIASAQNAQKFEAAIRNGNSEQLRDALFELKKIADAEASLTALPALKSSDEMVRSTAASAVIWLPADDAVAALLPLLSDPSEFVRREAALALGQVGDSAACSSLLQIVRKEKILEVRNAAIIALGNIGDTSAIEPLVEILEKKPNDHDEFTRRSAARSIGQIATAICNDRRRTVTPKNFLPLKYKEIEPENRTADLSRSFTNAVPVLTKIVNNTKESIDTRREAAAALGFISDPAALPLLKSCSQSSDPYLSEICKEAILRFGGR